VMQDLTDLGPPPGMTVLTVDIPVLRAYWGGHYQIRWDWARQLYCAASHTGGRVLEHHDPAVLWQMIRADYIAHPEPDPPPPDVCRAHP